jgi:AhpD family alkylhydroperoxidase
MDERTKKLIAVGASVGANCHPCLEYHIGKALDSGIERGEILEAVETAKAVRGGATASMDALALKILSGEDPSPSPGKQESCRCCS